MKFLMLYLLSFSIFAQDFQPQTEINYVEINQKINNLITLASGKNFTANFTDIQSSDVIYASTVQAFFDQFKPIDNNHTLIDINQGDVISAITLNHNLSEVERIINNKLYLTSCLEILNSGVTTSANYTIDPDGFSGPQNPMTVFCDMTTNGGGWTVIIEDPSTDLAYLSQFGDTSEINSTFYTNSTYGIGWGTNDNSYKELKIDLNYDEVYVTYTGFYAELPSALGFMIITSNLKSLVNLTDAWASWQNGQTLSVNGSTIFNQSRTPVVNRTDQIPASNSSSLRIEMKGFTSAYSYSRRWIKRLMIR